MPEDLNYNSFQQMLLWIEDFRQSRVGTNDLISQLFSFSATIDNPSWKAAAFPIIGEIEEVYAVSLDNRRQLTEADREVIETSIKSLERIIKQFSNCGDGAYNP